MSATNINNLRPSSQATLIMLLLFDRKNIHELVQHLDEQSRDEILSAAQPLLTQEKNALMNALVRRLKMLMNQEICHARS